MQLKLRGSQAYILYHILLAGVQLYGGPRASRWLNILEVKSFHIEYSSLACTVEIVDDVFAAIDHIHKHGRHVRTTLLLHIHLYLSSLYFMADILSSIPFSAVLILIALLLKILKLPLLSFVMLIGRLAKI